MKRLAQSGLAAVELALIIAPMLILCFGITELGRALYQYDGVVKSARDAARYLTQQNLNDPTSDAYKTAVSIGKSLAVCGKQSCSSSDPRLVTGLNSVSQVSVATFHDVQTKSETGVSMGTVSLVSVTIGGAGNLAVKFTPVVLWVIPNIDFSPVKITMAFSTT